MKKLISFLAAVIAFPLSGAAETSVDSAALEIVAPNGAVSYMVGLYHFDIDQLPQIALDQIGDYDLLVIERGPPSIPNTASRPSRMNSQHLSLSLQERAKLLDHIGCLHWNNEPITKSGIDFINTIPSMASSAIWVPCGTNYNGAVKDYLIFAEAKRHGIPIVELDYPGLLEQLRDTVPISSPAESIRRALKTDMSEFHSTFFEALSKGDFDKVRELSAFSTSAEYTSAMNDQRNISWMPSLKKALMNGNTLVAVGAAHLGGQAGVINLLRSSGFEVTPTRIPAE